ncbi:MAG TPA: phosphate ABC transporter substrate-binding protein, partial [Mycobacterium sp.]
PTPARSTCSSAYPSQGIANTMAQFMNYVACAGQVHMAEIGYAPLPPQLSQFLANAVGWMLGQPAAQLNASNCSNPTFSGSLGAGAAPPPLPPIGNAPGGSAAGAKSGGPAAGGSKTATAALAAGAAANSSAGAASSGNSGTSAKSAGGGTSNAQQADPAALQGGDLPTSSWIPLLALLIALLIPVVIMSINRKRGPT